MPFIQDILKRLEEDVSGQLATHPIISEIVHDLACIVKRIAEHGDVKDVQTVEVKEASPEPEDHGTGG